MVEANPDVLKSSCVQGMQYVMSCRYDLEQVILMGYTEEMTFTSPPAGLTLIHPFWWKLEWDPLLFCFLLGNKKFPIYFNSQNIISAQ